MPIDTPEWVRNAVFYQIFPDRFARRESAGIASQMGELEAWDSPPTVYGFKGGDLYGVIDRLDYLVELGITALYFCPIFCSAANHRYHTYDYRSVDPLLGGNQALRELLNAAHDRDIRVVLDGVFNHASRGFWQFHHVLENGHASPYRDWFHFDPDRLRGDRPFQPYPAEQAQDDLAAGQGSYEAIGYSAWWNLPALPKFNTDCAAVREFLLEIAAYWIDFGIDGWRLDVPNEIDDDDFWREFRRRVRTINPDAYIVGEVWGEAARWLQGDMWDAVMNYQITAAALGYFGGAQLDLEETRRPSSFSHVETLDAGQFAAEVTRVTQTYAPEVAASQLNLLDSHDMPRFLTCCSGDIAALKMAWLFICLIPGAPCVYYGDEIGLEGRQDPDCRRSFPWEPSRWNTDLRRWYQECIALRKSHECTRAAMPRLEAGEGNTLIVTHPGPDGLLAIFNSGTDAVSVNLSAHSQSPLLEWASRQPAADRVTIPGRHVSVFVAG